MKTYRCIFNFSHGRTTLGVVAISATAALREAQLTVNAADASIEIWDETGLVLERKAPCWRAAG